MGPKQSTTIKQYVDILNKSVTNVMSKTSQSANQQVATINTEIETLSSTIDDHDKVRKKLEAIQEIARKVDNKLDNIKKDISFFESHNDCPTCRQGIEHEHKASILEKNNSQVTKIEQGKQEMAAELDIINNRLSEIATISADISTKNKLITEFLVQIRTWSTFVNQINKEIVDIGNNTKQIDANNAEMLAVKILLKEAIAEKEELSKDKQVYDIAATLLKDTGIKTKIIRQYVPVINKLINKYLAAMDFFVSFELNENFEETIKSRFRDEFTYDSFSEGEKMRIDLALLFAWRAVAKLRNSASTNLLIMDEVFDSSLDSSGTDEFLKILNGLTSDTNTFIISHKGDQLFDKFEHVIKFEKHKNFSRIA